MSAVHIRANQHHETYAEWRVRVAEEQRGKLKRRYVPVHLRRKIAGLPCATCGRPPKSEVDHIIPISRGGDSSESNLQPLCGICNMAKGARL